MSGRQRGWATRVVRDHVGAAEFDAALEQTFLRDIGEEELERMEAENRSKGLSEKPEWLQYAEEMNLAEYAGRAVETHERSGPASDLSLAEERLIGEMMAEYGGSFVETPAQATDLSEQEDRGNEAHRPSTYVGLEEMQRIAAADDGSLPEHMRADEELKASLLEQSRAEHFGVDDPNVSDEEMWSAYQRTVGEDA
jgi:hypothetical protein